VLPAVPRSLVGRVSAPYIAGPTLDDARSTVEALNAAGKRATVDVLGEEVHNAAESEAIAAAYRDVLAAVTADSLDANISVKLTGLGLKVDLDLCRSLLEGLVREAGARGSFVRIDMVALADGFRTGAYKTRAERDACYQAVVGASSAIPIAFAPKFVDGQMLVDGGARSFLFLTQVPTESAVAGMTRRLFAFVHGSLSVACTEVGNSVLAIAERTSSIAGDQNFKGSIRLLEDLAQRPLSRKDPTPTFKTYYAAAANAASSCEPIRKTCDQDGAGGDLFCPAYETCLAARGRDDGITAVTGGAAGDGRWLRFEKLSLGSQSACVKQSTTADEKSPPTAVRRTFQ